MEANLTVKQTTQEKACKEMDRLHQRQLLCTKSNINISNGTDGYGQNGETAWTRWHGRVTHPCRCLRLKSRSMSFSNLYLIFLLYTNEWKMMKNICDMIKGNESDDGNINFELQAKRGNKFLCFTLFLILKIVRFYGTRCPIEMGFGSKCSIFNGQVIYIENSKLNFADM